MNSVTPGAIPEDPRFPDPRLLRFEYDRKRDILYLSVRNPGPALSIDVGSGVWMRFVPATREMVAFEIEDFERSFLRRNPLIAEAWRAARGRSLFGIRRRRRPERFFDSIIRYLRHAFATHPRQFSLPA